MFQLKIDTGNAAFHEPYGDAPDQFLVEWELRRILSQVSLDLADWKTSGKCIDINGNVVGEWSLT